MARRSGRKTKAPELFDPVVPIRDSSAQQATARNKRAKRNLLNPSNALQTNSPILKQDIQAFFASTVRNWSLLPEDKKRTLIDAFPTAYRTYDMDEMGRLNCPISEDFAANDNIVKRDVARFKRDVEAGFYLKKWQDEGKRAMQARADGQFDGYLQRLAEENFGRVQGSQENRQMGNV
jgi:Asx homology domain